MPTKCGTMGRQAGVTLIELIVAMVIIGVGVAGMTAAFTRTSRASVDPVIEKQLLAAAEGIMEEILLKPFDVNPEAAPTRNDFNDVRDFNNYGLTGGVPVLGIKDVNGDAIAELSRYSVEVRITPVTLTNMPACAPNADCALAITVTVRRGAYALTLTGWRTDFA